MLLLLLLLLRHLLSKLLASLIADYIYTTNEMLEPLFARAVPRMLTCHQ